MTWKYKEKDCRLFSTTIGLLIIMLYASCTEGCLMEELPEKETAVIRLHVESENQANASTRVAENDIKDLHILIYDSKGELIGQKYTTNKTVSVKTRSATNCTIYAIANTGKPNLFNNYQIHSESYLKGMTHTISAWNELGTGAVIPMTGQLKNVKIVAGMQTLSGVLKVSRMAAKVTLNVKVEDYSEITITGYRIYGLPKRAYYVLRPLSTTESSENDTQATRAEDAARVTVAADWTNSGNLSPTSATTINTTFYMFENRAGVNTSIIPADPPTLADQQKKNQTNARDSAAYVVVYGYTGYERLSWRIYLGANNTNNFNIKRNGNYTYSITLKRTRTDTRVAFKRKHIIWAGSNVYWDGKKLTFDETVTGNSDLKQGVFFRWGTLIGAPSDHHNSSGMCYVPSYNETSPRNSTWQYKTWSFDDIYCFFNEALNSQTSRYSTYLSDIERNTAAFYKAYKGDICRYLSKTGAVSRGDWRMPTSEDWGIYLMADGTPDPNYSYEKKGTWELVKDSNADGTTVMSSYVIYTSYIDKQTVRVPASGYFRGNAQGRSCNYWVNSACDNKTHAYSAEFAKMAEEGVDKTSPFISGYRTGACTIRCVRYE